MSVELSKVFETKKFMWDGAEYETDAAARDKEKAYAEQAFETRVVPIADGKFAVYTRRIPLVAPVV